VRVLSITYLRQLVKWKLKSLQFKAVYCPLQWDTGLMTHTKIAFLVITVPLPTINTAGESQQKQNL
jgi:hypothetical protein